MANDMLVKLYDLPKYSDLIESLDSEGIQIRRAFAPDKDLVLDFIRNISGVMAKGEADVSFANRPISTFLATDGYKIIGYACYDATGKNYFGPTAVLEEYRGKGIGKALTLRSLDAMYQEGYNYAIIGAAGPTKFYEKICNAEVIPDSSPGGYKDFLTPRQKDL